MGGQKYFIDGILYVLLHHPEDPQCLLTCFGDPKRGLLVQELPARWPHCHILIHLFPKGLAPLILPNFFIPSGIAKWWLFLQSLCIYSLWFSLNNFLLSMICYPEVQFIPAQQKKYFMFSNLLIHFQNSGLVLETSNDDQWIFVKVLVWIHGYSWIFTCFNPL